MQYCALGPCEGRCVVALSDEPSCSDSEPGDTCDGECRCESCWDPEPSDAEVIAELRARLKMRDVQLQQQNEQCAILLAKLAEVRRERDEAVLEMKRAVEEEEAAEYKATGQWETPMQDRIRYTIVSGPFAGQPAVIGPGGGIVDPNGPPAKGTNGR